MAAACSSVRAESVVAASTQRLQNDWIVDGQLGTRDRLGQRVVISAAHFVQRGAFGKRGSSPTSFWLVAKNVGACLTTSPLSHLFLASSWCSSLLLHTPSSFLWHYPQPPSSARACLFTPAAPQRKPPHTQRGAYRTRSRRQYPHTTHNGCRLARGRRAYAGPPLWCQALAHLREGF